VWREGNFGFSPEADAIVENALETIRGLGAEIVDPADIPDVGEIFGPEFTVLLYEFKADIRAYLSELRNTRMRTLRDLINFNQSHERAEMRWFGQEIFLLSQTFGPLTEPGYLEALATSKRLARQGIDGVMDRYKLDAIVHPVSGPPWTTDLVNGDHFFPIAGTTPAAVAGYPHINVPAGYSHRQLPVGISFTGRAWSEPALLRFAYAFEQAANARHSPRFLRSLGIEDFVPRAARSLGSGEGPAVSSGSATSAQQVPSSSQASARPSLL
jgi:amidase